jgi:hypothetical protein
MREKIEIEDDCVRLLRLTPSGQWIPDLEFTLEPFVQFLTSITPVPAALHPLLPVGCRWYGKRQKVEVLVVEEPPTTRRLRFAARTRKLGDEAPEEHYELMFPYVLFVFFFLENDFEEVKVFYRPAPIRSLKDGLFLSNLFNVQLSRGHRAYNRACLRPVPEVRGLPLHEQVDRLISHFWSTEFNLDIEDSGFAFYCSKYPELQSLADWQNQGHASPLFALTFPWEPAGMTLEDLVGSLLDRNPGVRQVSASGLSLGDLCYAFAESQVRRPRFDHREGIWRT